MPRVREAVRRSGQESFAQDGAGLEALIAEAEASNAKLLGALESLQQHERVNDKLVIGRCMTIIRRFSDAGNMSPSAREEARAVYKLCRASLGLDP